MVQCSQSPVRQHRGVCLAHAQPRKRRALGLLYHISKLTLRVPLVFTKKYGIYAAKFMLRLRLAFTNRTYYTTSPGRLYTFFFKSPDKLRLNMLQ